MKYNTASLNELRYKEYILLIAEELNKNGFTEDDKPYEVSTNADGNFVSDFSRALILSLKDVNAVNYLKEIGLLNNGRCPLTGLMITESTKATYTSEYDDSVSFDINNKWTEYNKVKRNWGCIIGMVIVVVSIFVAIFDGLNMPFYTTIGLGVALMLLSSLYGGSKFGNNWNVICLSDNLCINTITLFEISKLANKGDISDESMIRCNIASGDIKAYHNWAYSSNLNI